MDTDIHYCFISYKKEDRDGRVNYVQKVINALERDQCKGKALDVQIDSEDIDYVMQQIREKYLDNTSVTIFLIGQHSSEKEGLAEHGHNKQNFIIRELQASLYNKEGFERNGLLGIVLPEMYNRVYGERYFCPACNEYHNNVNISDDTVIREFSENYWLEKINYGCENVYAEDGRYAVLVKLDDFLNDPKGYVDMAYNKRSSKIAEKVHWRDIKHKGNMR